MFFTDFNYISTSHQERFKVVHRLTMQILDMHLIGNSTCFRGAIQDHFAPSVPILGIRSNISDILFL